MYPTSHWTGKVNATVDVSDPNFTSSCTFQGDFDFEIHLPPTMPGTGSSQGTPPSPSAFKADVMADISAGKAPIVPNTMAGSINGSFSSTINRSSGQDVTQGSGMYEIFFAGTYDPNAHTVSFGTTGTGIQATGSETVSSAFSVQTIPVSINGGEQEDLDPVNQPVPQMTSPPWQDAGGPFGTFDLGNSLPSTPQNSTIALDLQGADVQTASSVVPDSTGGSGTRTTTWIFTFDPHLVTVQVTPGTPLDPTDTSPSATLTITVTLNKQPAIQECISVNVCTYLAADSGDGHTHDTGRQMCDRTRPVGQLTDTNGVIGPAGQIYGASDYPLSIPTDNTGKITMTYTPPKAPAPPKAGNYYISGKDKITASIQGAPIYKDQQDIITQVQNLQPLPLSTLYQFGPQPMHPGEFYGTVDTNQSMGNIASIFSDAQEACQLGGDPTYGTNPATGKNFSTPTKVQILTINAMSLAWGGVNDIGHAPYGIVWNPPHYSHSDGLEVDIALFTLPLTSPDGGPAWDTDRIYLLRSIILQDPNFDSWGLPTEGGDMTQTLATAHAHFHVNFKN